MEISDSRLDSVIAFSTTRSWFAPGVEASMGVLFVNSGEKARMHRDFVEAESFDPPWSVSVRASYAWDRDLRDRYPRHLPCLLRSGIRSVHRPLVIYLVICSLSGLCGAGLEHCRINRVRKEPGSSRASPQHGQCFNPAQRAVHCRV